jgi:membrane protein
MGNQATRASSGALAVTRVKDNTVGDTNLKGNSTSRDSVVDALSPQTFISWLLGEGKWLVRVIVSSGDRFYWDNGFSKAAALAYSSLLSMVPLTALCFAILGAFGAGTEHAEVQRFLFQQFVPSGSVVQDLLPKIQDFSETIRSLNVVVIAALVLTSLLLLSSIEYALNQVWQVYEARSLTDRTAIFCAIIVLVPLFAVSGYYTSTKVAPLVASFGPLSALYQDTLPLLIDFLAFVALYYLVPKAPVKIGPAAFGAFCAAAFFGTAKFWFATYIVQFSNYNAVYGSIAIVPVFLFWLYVSWTIVLFGAELSYQAQNLPRFGRLWSRSLMTVGDAAMLLSIQALIMVVRAFNGGKKIPNEIELAERLGCSSVVLKPSLDALEQAGIVMRGDGRDMPLLLMRSPESITVAEVQLAVFKKRSSMILGVEIRRLYECYSASKDPQKVSIADLCREEPQP